MDLQKELAKPKSWLTHLLFKSRLMGSPLYREILTLDNRVQKIVIFNGAVMEFWEIGQVLTARRGQLVIFVTPTSMNPRQQAMVDLFVRLGVLKEVYEEHPFHKLKNPLLIDYDMGPKYREFTKFISEISMQETELILESDLIDEQRSGSDPSGE